MKTLSLWQPWATAIAVGSKRIETRGWATSYRGPLLIHAAKRLVKDELIYMQSCWNWCAALAPIGMRMGDGQYLWDLLPFGALIARCNLVDCVPTGSLTGDVLDVRRYADEPPIDLYSWTERMMGDFSLGRFAWMLEDVKPLLSFLHIGRQGLFEVSDEVVEQLELDTNFQDPSPKT